VLFTAAQDYDETLRLVASVLVPRFADWCAVDLVEDDGTVRRVAVAHANPAKADLTRATAVYPEDPHGRHPRTRVLRTGKPLLWRDVRDAELPAISRDGAHLSVMRAMGYVSALIVPLVAHGRTLGAVTCTTGESGRRYGEQDLELAMEVATRAALAVDNARLFGETLHARAQAEEATRARDQFLSLVSHELRTPLASILGWVAVLRTGKLPASRATHALEIIERSGRQQARLIDDLLEVARIDAGRMRLEVAAVDLTAVVRATVDSFAPVAEQKGVVLETAVDAAIPAIYGDSVRLAQVVSNLLDNAVKFTPAGGRVAVELRHAGREAVLVVRDTGRGIPHEFLPRAFQAFQQLGDPRLGAARGLGLGLSIVRHIVAQHGGSVAVASAGEGAGTTFTVTLPVASGTPDPPGRLRALTS
jgi:signal transduction histidine kinase